MIPDTIFQAIVYEHLLLFDYATVSEFRSWTLYYGLPVLKGILRTDYINHFALFSEALWLLLPTAPSVADVSKAEGLLQQFCFKYAIYYGR